MRPSVRKDTVNSICPFEMSMRPWVRKRTRLILFVPRDVNETLGEEEDTVNSICPKRCQ